MQGSRNQDSLEREGRLDGRTPIYLRDRALRVRIEGDVRAAFEPIEKRGVRIAIFEDEPPFDVAPLSASGGAQQRLGLGIAWAHAPTSPIHADPYDGTAFELAKKIRDAPRDLTHLVLGLPGDAAGPRALLGRLDELASFAYEMRRATGVEPHGLVLRGGVAPAGGFLGRPDHDDPRALVAAWERVARALPDLWARYGLPLDELLLDLGPPADSLTIVLQTRATAASQGWDPTLLVDAPACALAAVRAGSAARGERSEVNVRLVSSVDPWSHRLARVWVEASPLPRVISLAILRKVSRVELREIT